MRPSPTPHDILRKNYGYRSFRANQLDVIENVMQGRDVFVLMPTGSGKSVCYQIPAFLRAGVGIVISPLIALMQDQVFALKQNGLRADYLNSSLSSDDACRVERRLLAGNTDLLYVAPERLLTESFQELLQKIPIGLFAIDEAHCVSQWGHDFRPEYLQIAAVTRRFAGVPKLALTATADAHTLGYFGESYPAPCGNCDNCLQPAETWDGTVAAQKALSCVYRTGQRFGAAHLTDILVGNASPAVLRRGHDRLKTFGVGPDLSAPEWRSVFRQLAANGLSTVNLAEISGFRLTERSWPVLKGGQAVRLRKDPPPRKSAKTAGRPVPPADAAVDEGRQPLFEKLRQLRLEISKRLNVPPYVVFHDKTLKEMATHRPSTRADLLAITGVGERKAEQYGDFFLDVIRKAPPPSGG